MSGWVNALDNRVKTRFGYIGSTPSSPSLSLSVTPTSSPPTYLSPPPRDWAIDRSSALRWHCGLCVPTLPYPTRPFPTPPQQVLRRPGMRHALIKSLIVEPVKYRVARETTLLVVAGADPVSDSRASEV
ncbi:hypothetical protein J6590_058891 [Homalodisca vitripennis]|nr:hypothetical protein J6590_058891 [Homalodisca vitripennis]